jgi:pSer/pThr/pTyr-binding forkhead associated (FHA) protein
MAGPTTSAELLDLGSGSEGPRRLPVPAHDVTIIGRDPGSDLVVPDPTVSRRHALLRWSDHQLWIEDLGSLGGTFVNDQRVTQARRLSTGDRIRLGGRSMAYHGTGDPADSTQYAASYAIDRQSAPGGHINNVAGNQYQSYVQHIEQQREPFLRDIAATRTKARVLVWIGLALTVVGFAAFGRLVLLMVNAIWDVVITGPSNPTFPPPELAELWNEKFLGVNLGLLGFAVCAAGQLLLIIGVVLHIVATARRRRVDRDLAIPPPWAGSGAR